MFVRRREAGETLVEILIAIVVIGIVGSVGFFAISFGASNSQSHRNYVTADQLLRNSAEATKAQVRSACANGGATYSVTFSALPAPDPTQNWQQYYVTNRHFTLPADIPSTSCPLSAATPTVVLSVKLPGGTPTKSLTIIVRKP